MPKHAALTIISRNYFSFAKTLAESYLRQHPGHDFYVVLADRRGDLVPKRLECGAEVVEIEDIGLPDFGRFIYRYSIMELNTAVKPFALKHLLERGGYDTVLYLDPDIWVFRPLSRVHAALESDAVSVVFTPHTRRPYWDSASPNETRILQSGTYNLGFIGLRRGKTARELLEWWSSNLYQDCVVDIPNGLFVDQKWMDLVPGFFPDHRIIHDPGYNAAYWNLHERPVTREGDGWKVGGAPLVFFHFSGYSPFKPHELSKHQDRFRLRNLAALKALTDAYAAELLRNGHAQCSNWPYAFERLPNGVRLPIGLVRDVMQWAVRSHVDSPDPLAEPDAFCTFLMSRGTLPRSPRVTLLYHFLLRRRTDVENAFPAAREDSSDREFQRWIEGSGVAEEQLAGLLPFEDQTAIDDYVADAFRRLRDCDRTDVWTHFAGMWRSDEVFEKFADWFATYGIQEMGFEAAHTRALIAAKPALNRVLHVYFLRGDLQVEFPALWEPSEQQAFVGWLRQHRHELGLEQADISLFAEFIRDQRELVEKMRFLYQHYGRTRKRAVSIYDVDEQRYLKRTALTTRAIVDWLIAEPGIRPIDHFVTQYGFDREVLEDSERSAVPRVAPQISFEFVESIRESFKELDNQTVTTVNLAGFLNAPTGMGESARSMNVTLSHAGVRARPMTLPHPRSVDSRLPVDPCLFGWPDATADLAITVANADSGPLLESFLPASFWRSHNIGYWVWETERLPEHLGRWAERYDEIWTPSRHSADAISSVVGCPVHVLPHVVDFAALAQARGSRERFGLPAGTLFGFMFDPESVLERKNVAGLVDVFTRAFRPDDDCYLVLKVNGRTHSVFEYEMIKAAARSHRVIFMESTLTRAGVDDFLASLDCYVSLHRAEGFGLTCAEAMALGLPVIATGYSGNLEFMRADNSELVPATIVRTQRVFGAYPSGTRWGEPDVDHAIAAFRKMLDGDYRAELGSRGQRSVRAELAPDVVGERARRRIRYVLGLADAAEAAEPVDVVRARSASWPSAAAR